MATKLERLTDESIEVLRRYAPTQSLSTAILLMDKEITTSKQFITTSITTSKQTVTTSNDHPVTTSSGQTGFVPASTLPSQMFKTKYKDKLYDVKSDKNGDYIIDDKQWKHIVVDGKVKE